MAVTITFTTIPIGSILTSTIASEEPESKNDFRVRILLDGNGTGLEESGITLSTGASLVELTGDNAVWEATIRPSETAAEITLTIAADAFSEGNVETTEDIRVSTAFPDADAEAPTSLFTQSGFAGITVTPTHIALLNQYTLRIFQHDGTSVETRTLDTSLMVRIRSPIDFINGDYLILQHFGGNSVIRVRASDLSLVRSYVFGVLAQNQEAGIAHTRRGVLRSNFSAEYDLQPYDSEGSADQIDLSSDNNQKSTIAHQNDLIYTFSTNNPSPYLLKINDTDELETITPLNIARIPSALFHRDAAIYRDTLYILTEDGVSTLDFRPYRPLATNTKTTIYPVFANEGDTIPLKQYCPDAHTITFGTGFDKPTYLSINADNELEITSNAVTETQPVLVRLTGINYIDSVDFQFYLIVVQAANPTVRDITDLAMYASTTFNLFDIVDNATSITFRSGQTQPTGSSISNGVFTVGTAGGTAYFTATNANGSTNFEIAIDVVSVDADNFSDTFRYRTEIAGIDVSGDVKGTPIVSESIDEVRLNVVTANRVNLTLRSDSTNGFKFNGGLADNFWDANSLNADGFQEPIKIYIESLISGSYVRSLLFSGRIHEPAASINEAEVSISARDISARLRNALVSDFGTLTKWDGLKQQSDAVNYEGVNIPESSLLPIQLGTGTAWSDRTKLDISRLPLSSEGPAQSNTGYLTSQDFRTAGGFLASLPILRFKTEHRAEDVRFLFKQLGINKDIYQTQIDIPAIERDTPFILNRGSVPFSIEDTRITRLPTDWVHDSTNDRLLIPLSNPESHIADLLVQYDLGSDSYRILHTFDKATSVHRITRRTSTDYYILSTKAIAQDRSAADLPRQSDKTAYAFDSAAVGSAVKIYAYNTNTGVLTAHVEETDTYPPQLGIHYHVGFENALYIDEFEGVTSDYRGAFKVIGSDLYYRYAKDGEFGVATADASGTTASVISETTLNYHNHLNFAFDVLATGTVYFVYSGGGSDFDEVSVASANHYTGTLTIVDDLSSYTQPLSIQATIVVVSGGGTHGTLQIIGLDENGQTQTVSLPFSDTPQTTTRVFPNPFTRITSATLTSNTTVFSVRISTIPTSTSSLTIKRISGGTVTTIFTETPDLDALTALDDGGGAYLGCHEALFHDDALYMLCPIQRVDSDDANPPVYTRSREKAAGAVLFSCDVTAGTPSLTVVEKWDFVSHSACNLIVHDNAVHYTEQPSAAEKFLPINSSL